MYNKIIITDKAKAAIENTLQKGDRVELIPVKDGVKIVKVRREELVKANTNI